MHDERDIEYIFVTFTAKNVKSDALRAEVTRFNKALQRLVYRKKVKSMNVGYVRKLEITYNRNRNDYHTHFHVIFAVNKKYFYGGTYLKHDTWLKLWQESIRDDSITQVDVRPIKKTEQITKDGEVKEVYAVKEIAKYVAKDSDYYISQGVFDGFYNALKGRQIITYSGMFKEVSKMFDDGLLDQYLEKDQTLYYWRICYMWYDVDYKQESKEPLTYSQQSRLKRYGLLVDDNLND